MIFVSIEMPDGVLKTLEFDSSALMIGRDASNDIALESEKVSRYHARISVDAGKVFIQDLESTNGMLINSKPATHSKISGSDKVSIGGFVLKVKYEA